MKRTGFLDEVKRMRFEEAYEGYQSKRLSQREAAQLLGVCDRSFRRYLTRYEDEGMDGILDRRYQRSSWRQAPVDEVMVLQELYDSRYRGWNVRHFHRWYEQRHAGQRNYSWVKNQLQRAVQVQHI